MLLFFFIHGDRFHTHETHFFKYHERAINLQFLFL